MELGPGGNELLESTAQEDEESRALDKRKYLALSRRCKEIEQVCASLHVHAYMCVILHTLPVCVSCEIRIWVIFELVCSTCVFIYKLFSSRSADNIVVLPRQVQNRQGDMYNVFVFLIKTMNFPDFSISVLFY